MDRGIIRINSVSVWELKSCGYETYMWFLWELLGSCFAIPKPKLSLWFPSYLTAKSQALDRELLKGEQSKGMPQISIFP